MSDAFYERHKRELEQLEARHQTRRIVVASLDDIEIVGLDSAADNDPRRVIAHVRFRAYETLSDSRNARVIEGVPRKRRALREDWTLVWHPTRGWLIDDIQRSRTTVQRAIAGPAPRSKRRRRRHAAPTRTAAATGHGSARRARTPPMTT